METFENALVWTGLIRAKTFLLSPNWILRLNSIDWMKHRLRHRLTELSHELFCPEGNRLPSGHSRFSEDELKLLPHALSCPVNYHHLSKSPLDTPNLIRKRSAILPAHLLKIKISFCGRFIYVLWKTKKSHCCVAFRIWQGFNYWISFLPRAVKARYLIPTSQL